MDTINIHAITKVQKETNIEISFHSIKRISILNAETIKDRLVQLVTNPRTSLYLNLEGISFIDSYGFDTLNKVYRIAKKYNSKLILVEVNNELFELIDLVRNYGIFDIDQVLASTAENKVA